jgi:hypothetical protein
MRQFLRLKREANAGYGAAGLESWARTAAKSSRSQGRVRHSGAENFSMASTSIDSQAVWPLPVRHE